MEEFEQEFIMGWCKMENKITQFVTCADNLDMVCCTSPICANRTSKKAVTKLLKESMKKEVYY